MLFLAALLVSTALRLWLATRHVRFIQSHRAAVPAAFAGDIGLEAHQKAADYSSAKTRFNMIGLVFNAIVLVALTFGGGL
jgi:STE24 endopeptidase